MFENTEAALGVIAVLVIVLIVSLISMRNEMHLKALEKKEVNKAKSIVNSHGMSFGMYLPSVEHHDNPELASALERLASVGYVVVDQQGQIVGKIATTLGSEEKAKIARSKFRLVDSDL